MNLSSHKTNADLKKEMLQASRPPFFIVGSDRSGTTMLRLMLDRASDGPAIPPETMFITDFRSVLRAGGLEDHDRAREFTRKVWAHPRVQMWGVGAQPQLPAQGISHEDAFRWAVEQPFLAYMKSEEKTWWADKTPPNIDHVDLLLEVFPEAKFVELVRDGRDVALSMLTMPWGDNNVWSCALRWAHCIREGAKKRERYPKNILLVKYEELVTDPAKQLERVSEFLDITYSDDMLAVEKTNTDKLQHKDWFSNLWKGINTSAMYKWRTKMSKKDQQVFLAAAAKELELHGYDTGGLNPATISLLTKAKYFVSNFLFKLVNFVRLRIIDERGAELKFVIKRKIFRQ